MTNTTPPPGNGPGLPELAEGYKDSVQPGFEKYQRKVRHFPYGYSPETAALLLVDLMEAIDVLNDGHKRPGNVGLDPLIYASKSLALALADALEDVDLEVRT